jgi:hypothetical protein
MRAILLAALLAGPNDGPSGLIDRRISERWEAEGVKAAPLADDYEFLRRLSIDLRGVIPTVDEVRAFAADSDPAKREKTVDAWLRSEDFVRAWSQRWSADLTINLGQKGKFRPLYDAFDVWVRDAVRSNMPYDRFVKRILTAKGPIDLDPAAGYLMAGLGNPMEGPKDVVERTSRIFLGAQIRCAECHDHPFDDWTQEDFYSMAAFFAQSRSEIRSGKEPNELAGWIVDDPAKGDAAPPLKGKEKEPKKSFAVAYKATGQGPAASEPRRAAFARLLVADPQFARAAVNRHWGLLVGRGFIHPLDGFGAAKKPSHPELLDELAADFVRSGYDVRRLVKSILLSRAYQLTSRRSEPSPDRLFARALAAPMSPEQLYDSLVRATGLQEQNLSTKTKGDPRSLRDAFLREFRPAYEQADLFAPPAEATISQALFFLNGEVTRQAVQAALRRKTGKAPDLEELFLAILSRPPSARESEILLRKGGSPQATEDIVWALLNSTEFVTRH